MTVAVLAGGVGAARFLLGLMAAIPHDQISAVVNTGDDTEMHGLSISPDLDTVVYTLAGAIDPERGWGLVDETWQAMESLAKYAQVRPTGSAAAPTWFNLGDRDLATHFYRTARRAEGASLTEVTAEIANAWGLDLSVLPMTDDRFRTLITLASSGEEIEFQDYFVRHRHNVSVSGVRFEHDHANLAEQAALALESSDVVVIAPSNPLVSIAPIRELTDTDKILAARRDSVVAVSPIVGGAALKGPADRMMTELGFEPSVVGVARLYAPIASTLVIDPVDEALATAVEAEGLRCVVHPSVMSTPEISKTLAESCLRAAEIRR